MKKGFTLIELLAVIVILAIIALIATPIVLNIIKDTKESATLRSADFYLDAVEFAVANARLNNDPMTNGVYEINEEGNLVKDEKVYEIEMEGEKPRAGTITIESGKIVKNETLELDYGNNVVVYDNGLSIKNEESNGQEGDGLDKIKIPEGKLCVLVDGEENKLGSSYVCNFGDKNREFYLLTEATADNQNVDLILSENFDGATNITPIQTVWTKLDSSKVTLPSANSIAAVYADMGDESLEWLQSNLDNDDSTSMPFCYLTDGESNYLPNPMMSPIPVKHCISLTRVFINVNLPAPLSACGTNVSNPNPCESEIRPVVNLDVNLIAA